MELFLNANPFLTLSVVTSELHTLSTPCLVLGIFEENKLSESALLIDRHTDHSITKFLEHGDHNGTIGRSTMIYHPHGIQKNDIQAKRILLIGCGKAADLNETKWVKIIRHMTEALSNHGLQEATCALLDLPLKNRDAKFKARLIIQAISTENYRFAEFKSKPDIHYHPLKNLTLHTLESELALVKTGIQEGQIIAEATTKTRHLGNLPSNICTPKYLSKQALSLAKQYPTKIKAKIYGEKELTDMGMNCLLGVGKGSREETQLIVLNYEGADLSMAPHVIIGKGVTFDSGGISIKPRQNMGDMKMDMCGAASVLSSFEAAVCLNLPINLIAIIPAAENMPDGNALQPGNIIKSHQGIFVEILDTDAEGRLILADAISHATGLKPQSILTTATLTGAIITALGHHLTGLFTNNQKLADKIMQAGLESHDGAWQMPLNDLYQEQINSSVADIANLGKDGANSITAAAFLSRFVKDIPWVHLDIAGTAMSAQGATGRPVPLLIQYLMDLAG